MLYKVDFMVHELYINKAITKKNLKKKALSAEEWVKGANTGSGES